MKSSTRVPDQLLPCAAEALKQLLRKSSAIRVNDIQFTLPGRGQSATIYAVIEIYGRSHTLKCLVNADSSQRHLKLVLESSRHHQRPAHQSLVVIAPSLSPEARAICMENGVSFIDFQGNARLLLGEAFIVASSLKSHRAARSDQDWRMSEREHSQVAFAS